MADVVARRVSIKLDLDSGSFNKNLGVSNSEVTRLAANIKPILNDIPIGISRASTAIDYMARAAGISSQEMRKLASQSSEFVRSKLDTEFMDAARSAGLLDSEIDKLVIDMNKTEAATKNMKSSFGGLKSFVVGLGLSAILTSGVSQSLELSRQYQTTGIQIQQLLGGSAELGKQAQAMAQKLADDTPFTDMEIINTVKQLLGMNVPLSEIEAKIMRLGDISAGSGKNLNELAVIYGQVMGKGKLMGDDLQQLINANVPLTIALANHFHVAKEQVREMASQGKISFKDFDATLEEMRSGAGIYADMMIKLSRTWEGRMSTLISYMNQFKRSVGDLLNTALEPLLEFFTDSEAGVYRVRLAMIIFSVSAVVALGAITYAAYGASVSMQLLLTTFSEVILPVLAIGAAAIALYLIFEDFFTFIYYGADKSNSMFEIWAEGLFGSKKNAEEFRQAVITIWNAVVWAGKEIWKLVVYLWPVLRVLLIISAVILGIAFVVANLPWILATALLLMVALIRNHWDEIVKYIETKWTELWERAGEFVFGIITRLQAWWDRLDFIGGAVRQFNALKSLAASIWRDIVQQVQDKFAQLVNWDALTSDFIRSVNNAIDGINSVTSYLRIPAIPHIQARADGGPITAGESYLVGERGPEIITAGSDGYVTPNHQIGSAGGIQFSLSIGSISLGSGTGADADNLVIRIRQTVEESLDQMLFSAGAKMGFTVS